MLFPRSNVSLSKADLVPHAGFSDQNAMMKPLYLDEEAVQQHLRMEELIPAMEKALIDFSAGKVVQPVRSVIKVDPPGGFFGLMPALADGLGIKLVTFYPTNAERGVPTHMATIFLADPQTGEPLAIMDGRLITEMRTAAVSAVATKLLAAEDAKCTCDSRQRRPGRAATMKLLDSLGISRKSASGAKQRNTPRNLPTRLAARPCPPKKPCVALM